MPKSTKKRIEELRNEIQRHNDLYYIKNTPSISDKEYDLLLKELQALEIQGGNTNSPAFQIGSDLIPQFSKYEHKVPVLSLENTYNEQELGEWIQKTNIQNVYSVEWKIDGASILLYYEEGILTHCVTRGTGGVGDIVTENVKTIQTIPVKLKTKVSMGVRGEIFMNFSDFEEFNEEYGGRFANPRNLAAGSIKHKDPNEVAKRPLRIFVYDAFFFSGKKKPKTHEEVLDFLKAESFPVAPDTKFSLGSDLLQTITTFRKQKDTLNFPVDGLVIKVNDLSLRDSLGETSHSPRWARAFKFDALLKETTIEAIDFAIGRTGKVTPRARVTPTALAGTTVTYATLHNQDYIDQLGAGIGAKVLISKRGEIIPAVEKVISPPKKVFSLPSNCPTCSSKLNKVDDSVDLFCTNRECPDRKKNLLIFFCAKKQMNIEGLGEKQIEFFFEKGWVRDIPDLYSLETKRNQILEQDGFGEKSVKIILDAIEKSKEKDFKSTLPSLGLSEMGPKVTELLIDHGFDSWEKLVELVKSPQAENELNSIHGIGPRTVEAILFHLKDKKTLSLVKKLQDLGLSFSSKKKARSEIQCFDGQSWCVTGSFEFFNPRDKAMEIIVEHGGRKVSSVSTKTTHLLYGPGAGSKLEKAKESGVTLVDEEQFIQILKQEGIHWPS